jgi:hypothetical protein
VAPLGKHSSRREQAAALLIVLALVVLLTGLAVAYLSRTTSDRQVAHSSFHQSNVDQLAQSAMDSILGDLRQEIVNGSANLASPGDPPVYSPSPGPAAAAYMVPQRSGNINGAPNLIRRSVRADAIPTPGVPSRASAVNSMTDVSANGRYVTSTRWNSHYLIPKGNPLTDEPSPIPAFTGATPDWVFVTDNGATVITSPNSAVLGRYAYAIFDEGGLLDMNVAGYPTDPSTAPVPAQRVGRKGSLAYADLRHLCPTTDCGAQDYGIPNPNTGNPSIYQIDRLVGWRNYATTQPTNDFPDSNPASQAFARNFQTGTGPATAFYNYVFNNTNGFLGPNPTATPWNERTDQYFVQRQELIAFRKATQFSANALQYLSAFSREINSPSFSPSTPSGSTIDYAALASTPNAVNPNFLLRRVTSSFTRFDGTTAVVGEPLVKTRFPLSRLAWITYKGPSAAVYAANNNDPAITQLTAAGVPLLTIKAGTSANIKASFGLVWDSRTPQPLPNNASPIGQQWVYTSPTSANTGGNFDGQNGNPASDIKRLDVVASENREPDFFELLRATILDGSIGQNTGGGVTRSASDTTCVFPDVHMSNKALHILTIGACIIDQADPDSIPTRVMLYPPGVAIWWAANGLESLPYIAQIYPITGISPADQTKWATYLLFQLWNPHIGPSLAPSPPQVRIRLDGGIGIFTGGNGQTWTSGATDKQTMVATGQSMQLTQSAFPPTGTPTPAPLSTPGVASVPAVGSATPPCGFERLPGNDNTLRNYVGLRLLPANLPASHDFTLAQAGNGQNNPRLTLYLGADVNNVAQPFNATMEYLVPGTANTWVPYNRFIGINDPTSWINGDTVPVHAAPSLTATPDPRNNSPDQFSTNNPNRLTDAPLPHSLMKSDPRSTRFGIFQFRPPLAWNHNSNTARITDPLWPAGNATVPNGYGGAIVDPADDAHPVEHAPCRFSTTCIPCAPTPTPSPTPTPGPYFPATFAINGPPDSRDTVTTIYADNDGVVRPADAIYSDPSVLTTGSSTPYYVTATAASKDYHPIILNRPLRNVAELGYAFRDLPWKTLDFFTDKSADAGLLDVFTINDGPALLDGTGNFLSMGPVPPMVAGNISLNTGQAAVLQSILAGAVLDEISTTTISGAGTSATSAPVIAANIVTETSTPTPTPNPTPCALSNRSELVTRPGLLNYILPVPATGAAHDQRVKSRREAVVRAISSVSQTRVWNLLIDVIAQSGRYPPNVTQNPNPADLPRFIVEGEQRYWVHVAIDRFTGQVIDKQIEVVNE